MKSVDDGQRTGVSLLVVERVGADLHSAERTPPKTDDHEHEIAKRLRRVGLRRLGSAARMRMIGADARRSSLTAPR